MQCCQPVQKHDLGPVKNRNSCKKGIRVPPGCGSSIGFQNWESAIMRAREREVGSVLSSHHQLKRLSLPLKFTSLSLTLSTFPPHAVYPQPPFPPSSCQPFGSALIPHILYIGHHRDVHSFGTPKSLTQIPFVTNDGDSPCNKTLWTGLCYGQYCLWIKGNKWGKQVSHWIQQDRTGVSQGAGVDRGQWWHMN